MWIRRAEFIVEKFNPKTFLDIGCAYGELVKALHDLGVDAYGIDGSEYAVASVDASIKDKIFISSYIKLSYKNKKLLCG